jgi:hypothetical protein
MASKQRFHVLEQLLLGVVELLAMLRQGQETFTLRQSAC